MIGYLIVAFTFGFVIGGGIIFLIDNKYIGGKK